MDENFKPAIFPTSYFPSIEYFALMIKQKEIYFEVQETYPKQTLRNRCTILSANGKLDLTVPISKSHNSKQLSKDVKISYDIPWQKIHQRAIDAAYNSSAFYLYFKDDFNFVFEKKHTFLIDLNTEIISKILKDIGLSINLTFTEAFNKANPEFVDYRNHFQKNHTKFENENYPQYFQVFDSKFGFSPNLSFMDLLYNEGNQAIEYLNKYVLFNSEIPK
ncbi:MAG: WbqC family protein [Bacteroidetes bacterium]|nr:WbqC family protein [Bacteroidota bacterium]